MKYLPQLSKEELKFICSQIPHQHAIKYFSKYPRQFTKIRRGFRPNKLSKREVESILFNFYKQDFISNFIEKHLQDWINEIQEHLSSSIQEGTTKEVALVRTLSRSYFSDNINLYFKLVGENYSKEFIGFLNALVELSREFNNTTEKCGKELKILENDLKKLITESDFKIAKYNEKLGEKVLNCSAEINDIKQRLLKLENSLTDIINENQKRIESIIAENTELKKKIETLIVELNEIKNLRIHSEKNKNSEKKEENLGEFSKLPNPKSPCDINEFKEYLSYNLESIGIEKSSEYFRYLISHLCQILFQGIPIITSHAVCMNLIKCIANTLIGTQKVNVLIYDQNITSNQISKFIDSANRIVCLVNFLGNFNETELIPIFEKHRDKIIFLTIAYNRTLYYISKEFLRYCRYLNLDRVTALSFPVSLTEDPSIIEEQNKEIIFNNNDSNRYQRILKQILEELDFSQSQIEGYCSFIKNEDDLCGLLAFEIMPYCKDVLQINPYNKSNQLNKYAGYEGRCPIKNLLIRWFA